jgi:dTDP-4-dehydrorhamnose reductase
MKFHQKPVLILGGRGYVGLHLGASLAALGFPVFSVSRGEPQSPWDIQGDALSPKLIENLIQTQGIQTVVNGICLGQVDQCEKNRDLAYDLNVAHVDRLLDLLASYPKVQLVHFSTNGVYGGDKAPYREDSQHHPKNYYGELKSQADTLIQEKRPTGTLLLRVMTLYGPKAHFQRDNPATFIIQALRKGQPLNLVDDVFNNFLFLEDLLSFIALGIEKRLLGVYNLAGPEILHRYELGLRICQLMGLSPQEVLSRVSSSDLTGLAPRAPHTSFDPSKALGLGWTRTPMNEGLKKTLLSGGWDVF